MMNWQQLKLGFSTHYVGYGEELGRRPNINWQLGKWAAISKQPN